MGSPTTKKSGFLLVLLGRPSTRSDSLSGAPEAAGEVTGPTVTEEETVGVEPRVVTLNPVEGPGVVLLDTWGGGVEEVTANTGCTGDEDDIS